jgi:MFS family permease
MRRSMVLLGFVEAIDVMAFTLLLPLIPELMQRFGLSRIGVLVLLAMHPLGAAIGAPLQLQWSQRWGRKPVIVAAGLLMAESLFVLAWAGDIYMLFMTRVMCGLAAGSFLPAEVWQREMGRSVGLRWTASAIGAAAGPALVWLGAGLGYSAPAYLAGFIAAVTLIFIVAMLDQGAPESQRRGVMSA